VLTIIVPTCGRPELLGRCLDRLAPGSQTLAADRYEVIVTDDGREPVVAMVGERYPWARWVTGPRRGPAANRNHGARHARGEWLAFVDDDCIPSPGWLAAYTAALRAGVHVYEGKTTCEAGIHSPLEHAPINLTGGWLWSCNMLIRKTLFEEMQGFDECFPYPHMEDVDFRERLASLKQSFDFVENASVDHPPRRVPGGRTQAIRHASWVYFWYKRGEQRYCTPHLLSSLLRTRARALLAHRLNIDTFVASWSLFVELAILLPRLPFWELRWRHPGR